MLGFPAQLRTSRFGDLGPTSITGRARFVHKDIPNFLACIETYSRRIPDRKICGYFWGLIPNSARLCTGAMVVLRQCRHRRQSRVGHQPTRVDSTEGIDAATARVSRCPAGRSGCPQGAVDKMVMQAAQISASTYECCLGVTSLRRVLAESIKPLDGSVFLRDRCGSTDLNETPVLYFCSSVLAVLSRDVSRETKIAIRCHGP